MRHVIHALILLPVLGSIASAAGAPLAAAPQRAEFSRAAVTSYTSNSLSTDEGGKHDLAAQIDGAEGAAARCLLDLGITPGGLTADQPDTTLIPLNASGSVVEVPETASSPTSLPMTLAEDGIEIIALTTPASAAGAAVASPRAADESSLRLLASRNLNAICSAVTEIGAQRS